MRSCPSCGTENALIARWCLRCGTHLIDPTVGRLASVLRRVFANLLDTVLVAAAFALLFIYGLGTGAALDSAEPGGAGSFLALMLGLLLVAGLFAYAIWALVLFATQGMTPGKKLVGIRVVQDDGSIPSFLMMLVREWVAKWVSGLVFGIGFIWGLIDKDRQCWHDKLVSTYVVEVK